MKLFDVDVYSGKSRGILKKIIEEIREQFLTSGSQRQFWFYVTRISDETLTEPIIEKWIEVLAHNGFLHYYRLANTDLERAVAFDQGCLEHKYAWEPQLITQYILGFPSHSSPSFALDILDTDLDQLIWSISTKSLWGGFRKDSSDRLYYKNLSLIEINKSTLAKHILCDFLVSESHTLTEKQIADTLLAYNYDDTNINDKRNKIISKLRIELRKIDHRFDIRSTKNGHKVDYYELIIPA